METIDISDLSAYYDDKQVLKNITASFKSKCITAIIGPSGCGKSTLLRCLNKTFNNEENCKSTGKILFNDTDILNIKDEILRQKIGLVSQEPNPFPFSIERNITFATKFHKINDIDVPLLLEKVSLYSEIQGDIKRSALELSGGQKQRLCIARALAIEPEVLMLDEPCSSLDRNSTREIEDVLVQLKRNITIILVTHNLAQAKRLADYVVCIRDGKIEKYEKASSLFDGSQASEDFLELLYE